MHSEEGFAGLVLVEVQAESPAEDSPNSLDGQRIAHGYAGRVGFKRLNAVEDADLCRRLGVREPGVVLIENGRVIDRLTRYDPARLEDDLLAMLTRRLRQTPSDGDCSDGSCRV